MRRWILGVFVAGLLSVPWALLVVGCGGGGGSQAQGGSDVQAEAEIARLPVIYAWSIDAMDIDTLMTIFSDDIEYDLSVYGLKSVIGKANVRALFISSVFTANQCSFITLSNMWSDVNGTSATGGDYYLFTGFNPAGKTPNTVSYTEGRHIYRFKKVSGEWKISYLKGELFFQTLPKDISSIPAAGLPKNCPMLPGM
jgi:SnoaL-like domain